MIRRLVLAASLTVAVAGCGTLSDSSPGEAGKDELGAQIYELHGKRLGTLEAIANSSCGGNRRPYYRSIAGGGDDANLTYICD